MTETVNTYDQGDLPTFKNVFTAKDVNNVPQLVDPSQVSFGHRLPDGTVAWLTYPSGITKVSQGIYTVDLLLSDPGEHYYRWYGEGQGQGSEERRFYVAASLVPLP